MSLRKKIIFGFFISAFIIAILAAFEYVNFVQIKNEMRFLEITDTVRSKSLQLRRHEKNFFLYPATRGETEAIYNYLDQLKNIANSLQAKAPGKASPLRELVHEYEERFRRIERLSKEISDELKGMRASSDPYAKFLPLIEANFLDRPLYAAEFLEDIFSLPSGHPLITKLRKLDSEINLLRKNGEGIITASKKLDKSARENVERGIHISQLAILVIFPLFLVIGLGALFFISNDVVKRLKTLMDLVEKTGNRYVSNIPAPRPEGSSQDEVGILVEKFNRMDEQLAQWEEELREKNQELLQSKKLAAIGTLASGIAHELNNPLNNIYISVQMLRKQLSDDASPSMREIVDDIVGQTVRVKGIVADLLEFAREREPQLQKVELNSLITEAFAHLKKSVDTGKIRFTLDTVPQGVTLYADPGQIERVFVNLFANAVAAMENGGDLVVKVVPEEDSVKIWVSDSGKGMSEEDREKIFDPFFTKKEKGTGLGLAIVLNIIKKHNGNISVVSEEGVGTAFEITLPKKGNA
jgi:signal transduction histidine kinase